MRNFISIIIPLKGRSKFTFRILSYLSLIKFPYKIYICDGSLSKSNNLKIINNFKSRLNLKYLKFPYDKNYKYFMKKIYLTLKLIKSNYVMLLPNDDFINVNFLKSIKKKTNKQIISGILLDFKINNFFRYTNDFGNIKLLKTKEIQYHKKLNNKKKLERLKYILSFNPYESIHPKNILLKVIKYSMDFPVNNHKEFMWFFKFIPLYYARVVYFKKPLLARQTNTYNGEGNTLYKKNNFSSNYKLLQFQNFILKKTKNKEATQLINNENLKKDLFLIKPNITIYEKILRTLIDTKLFLSLMVSLLNFNKKDNIKNYKKVFNLINKIFKINE